MTTWKTTVITFSDGYVMRIPDRPDMGLCEIIQKYDPHAWNHYDADDVVTDVTIDEPFEVE